MVGGLKILTIRAERGEGSTRASLLDILVGLGSRESKFHQRRVLKRCRQNDSRRRLSDGRSWSGQYLTTIDQIRTVMSEDGEFLHRSREHGRHLLLVGDERLPETGRTRVTGEVVVGLETKFANHVADCQGHWRFDFALIASCTRETDTAKLSLEEELGIEL